MLNKLTTITMLTVASVAMANAETEWTSTQSDSSSNDRATSAGFLFNLGSTRLTTTSNPTDISLDALVSLDSINLAWRSNSASSLASNVGFVLTNTSNSVLAISVTTGNVTAGGNITIDFGGVEISSSTDYRVWFTTGVLSSVSIGDTITSASVRQDVGIELANYGTTTAGTGLEVIRYTSGGMWDTKYAPVVTINTSSIPEPSMFGLLAGLGALALVGSRRRRK